MQRGGIPGWVESRRLCARSGRVSQKQSMWLIPDEALSKEQAEIIDRAQLKRLKASSGAQGEWGRWEMMQGAEHWLTLEGPK